MCHCCSKYLFNLDFLQTILQTVENLKKELNYIKYIQLKNDLNFFHLFLKQQTEWIQIRHGINGLLDFTLDNTNVYV